MRKLPVVLLLIFFAPVLCFSTENPRFIINSGHTGMVSSLDYQKKDLLISGGHDGTLKIWDTLTGKIKYQLQVSHMPIRKITVCPEKPVAAVIVSDGINSVNMTVWNWQTGELIFRHRMTEVPLFLKFSPNGTFLVYGKMDWNSLVFLDTETGKNLNLIPEGFGIVSSVFISGSEKTLLTYNNSGSIQYWDLTNGKQKTKLSTIPNLKYISFTVSGRYMTGFTGKEILLIDLTNGTRIASLSAENLTASYIDPFSDRLVWTTKSPRGIAIHTASISGNGFDTQNDTQIINFQAPTEMLSVDNKVFTAYATGSIYVKSAYSDNMQLFSANNLLKIDDFAVNETAMAVTSRGKLLTISAAFFMDRANEIINPETMSRTIELDASNSYGVSGGREGDFLVWESDSKTGGTIRIFDSNTGDMTFMSDISAPLLSAECSPAEILTLDRNGECRVIDYSSGVDKFKYTSFGLKAVDFTEGGNIVAGRNSSSTLNTPLLHINTRTGETVPIEDSDLLVFALQYDKLTRKLYTLGFEERNGIMRTVLKQHTGRGYDRAETLLAFPGENIDSSFTSDPHSSKIFTSLGYGGVKMLYWGGFTSLEQTFSIPKTLKLKGNFLASINNDSSFTIYNPSNGTKVMDLFIFRDSSWAAILNDKFYVAGDAEKYINIYDGNSDSEINKADYIIR